MSLQVGTRVGAYEVTAAIGAGGMGQVYRARDTQLGRDVALKVVSPEFARDPERLSRFKREAQVLASLNHPHIGSIYGFEDGALVLEYVDGPTLADRVAQGALPLDEALPIAMQIADALEAAHAQGIVHRDLKPANIKVRPDGAVKVLDFGLAKSLEPAGADSDAANSPTFTGATHAGVILGTAAYMSPEQARGKAVDKRTDVWAFGCVVYEMITGRSAFGRETVTDTIAAVVTSGPDWTRLPPSLPAPLARMLHRCLEKDPKHRLRDIADARLDIEEALRGDREPPAQHPARRVGVPGVGIGLLIGAAVAGIAVATLLHQMPQPEAPEFSRVVRLTSGPDRELGPAISPDAKWVAYLSDAGGKVNVWVKFLAGGEPANLTAGTGLEVSSGTGIGGIDIAPEGNRIAIMARTGSGLRYSTWEIAAPLPGRPRRLLEENLLGMRWSPDGKRITFINAGGAAGDALWVADADGGNRRQLIAAQDAMHLHWPTWSDDGYIYFIRTFSTIVNLDQSEIYRIDANGARAMEPVVETLRRAQYPVPLRSQKGLIYSANPLTAEMRLWWRSADGRVTRQLVSGVGDYSEPRASADGSALVSTLYELRQSLVRIAVSPAAPVITPVTDGYHGDLDPVVSPAGDEIVFSSSREGNRHIWIARLDGTDARPLTSGPSQDDRPAFSPDGRQVAFASDRGGTRAIWLMPADGGSPRKLVDAASTGITWTRDGQFIIYSAAAGAGPGLFKLPVAGGASERVTTPFFASEPTASPTRDLVAYLSTRREGGLVTSSVAFIDSTGKAVNLTLPDPPTGAGFANGLLSWSPDGRRLAVVRQPTNSAADIWVTEPGISWTRDGTQLIIGRHDWTSDIVLIEGGK